MNACYLVIRKIYMSNHILVTGKNSQLGKSLQKILRSTWLPSNLKIHSSDRASTSICNENNFIFVSRDMLDFSDSKSIKEFFKNNHFSGVINFAAYTSVDKAESNVELVEQINHYAVAQIAEISKIQNIPLIHISTDYVFHGRDIKPYDETDKANPKNVYGTTKMKGEKAMKEAGCKGAIIRTSWLHSEFGKNFVKTMLKLGRDRDSLGVVIDQVGSPTYATNLAKVILTMLNQQTTIQNLNSQLTTYHFSDDGVCSWYDFAKTIFELSEINCQVNPLETNDYYSAAKRPLYNVMSKNKIKRSIPGLETQHWKEALKDCLTELKKKEF